ncbi:hypothetical protein [Phytohalomonas tamaricis]|uniref:hypothetical protein n=1 Tax=Phytohalomonas tamaricis TaxID=2081032 RepID=UPI0021D46FCB|nr:hypothetical protein [Phytohalomonas tamaricis]
MGDHRLPELPVGHFAIMGDLSGEDAVNLKGTLNPSMLRAELDEQRMFKSDYEVACIHRANALAAKGHHAARGTFSAGEAELDIHCLPESKPPE